MKNFFFLSLLVMGFGYSRMSSAASNEIKGFRYHVCENKKCISVTAPSGWISQANGAFVASGVEQDSVELQMTENGKTVRTFRGNEAASQPDIDSITIDSARQTVLIDVGHSTAEVISKTSFAGGGK